MTIDALTFLAQFLRHPLTVGAVLPSSAKLARDLTAPIPASGDPVVVELGPGTGALSAAVQDRLGRRGRHLGLEINQEFAVRVAARHPGMEVIQADAARIVEILAERGLRHADVILSGLPWAVFTATLQRSILTAVAGSLSPNGAFTTFAYRHAIWTPPARRLRALLGELFEEVTIGRTVWRNGPPALVYHCRRPLPAVATRRLQDASATAAP